MRNALLSIAEASGLIATGQPLAIAGDEACLARLPRGAWIGGTIPYFMTDEGGLRTHDKVFVTPLPEASTVRFDHVPAGELSRLVSDAPENGFALVIMPASSSAHARYAQDCRQYPDAFLKPTVGWIAGVALEDIGRQTAKVYDGTSGRCYEDGAVVAYVSLPAPRLASIEIVNMFEPDGTDRIQFTQGGFSARECLVNGERVAFAEYLAARGVADGRLPLVGDFAGAHANVSFQNVDAATGDVTFYAPVFTDVVYWIAKPVADYAGTLRSRLAGIEAHPIAFSCNCILNYAYGNLEGQKLGSLHGPITFGEIGHQLLNQTVVALRID